jgi:hypothetical protein
MRTDSVCSTLPRGDRVEARAAPIPPGKQSRCRTRRLADPGLGTHFAGATGVVMLQAWIGDLRPERSGATNITSTKVVLDA